MSDFQFSGIDGVFSAMLPLTVFGTSAGTLSFSLDLSDPSNPTIVLPSGLDGILSGADFDPSVLAAGITAFLTSLEKGLVTSLDALPLISKLNLSAGTGVFGALNSFVASLATANFSSGAVTSITNLLESSLSSILVPSVPGAMNPNVMLNQAGDEIDAKFEIKGTDTYTIPLATNLGGLGLNFTSTGGLSLKLGYDMRLGFALNKTSGFSFILNPDPTTHNEFTFTASAGLTPDASLTAKLFFLDLTATNQTTTGPGTGLNAMFGISLPDMNGDGELSLADLGPSLFSGVYMAIGGTTLTANIDLLLVADINMDASLPSFSTDLTINYPILSGMSTGDTSSMSEPTVALDNMTLNFGSLFGKVFGPIMQDVNGILGPIKPILDFLNGDVPVVSNLSEEVGLGPVKWDQLLELAANLAGADFDASSFNTAIQILDTIVDLAGQVESFSADATGINFGDYKFNSSVDLRTTSSSTVSSEDPSTMGTQTNSDGTPVTPGQIQDDIDNDPDTQFNPDTGDDQNSSGLLSSLKGTGLDFPILDKPLSIVSFLLGQNVTLIKWTLPTFSINVPINIPLAEIPVGPFDVNVLFTGDVGLTFNATVGLDTSGIKQGNFLDGLFFGTTKPLLTATFSVGAGVEVGVYIVNVGFDFQLGSTVNFGFADLNHNGEVYLQQVLTQCAFEESGDVFVKADFLLTFGISIFSYTIDIPVVPAVTLFSFSNNCATQQLAHYSTDTGEDAGIPVGTLILNTGPYSGDRQSGASGGDDFVQVTPVSGKPGVYQVAGFGTSQDYGPGQTDVNGQPEPSYPITGIYASGVGDSSNEFHIDPGILLPTTLIAGTGKDQILGGGGKNLIEGGGGPDYLQGGGAADTIKGGDGNDTIETGKGNVLVIAGNGNNHIMGQGGNNTIIAGSGNDTIFGGTGNDYITVGGGNDQIYGQGGNNTIIATGAGTDLIEGGPGSNMITSGMGQSVIFGDVPSPAAGSGNDTILGGGGADTIYGGTGHNTIHGGSGNDLIQGGPLADMIYADTGTDMILGEDGNDSIYGGTGGSSMYGGEGNDNIYGGIGSQYLNGGDGNDFLYGGTGNQTMVGGTGDDYFQTGTGNEQIFGGTDGNKLLVQFADANQALTNNTLTGLGTDVYSQIDRISLTMTGAVNDPHAFDVSGFTGIATLISDSGNDVVASTDDANFTPSDGRLDRSDGAALYLVNITKLNLTATGFNTFDITTWTGTATLTGTGGVDEIESYSSGNQTLTDTSFVPSSGGSFTLSGINAANLTAGPFGVVLNAIGFSGQATLYGGAGNDTLEGGSGDDYIVGGAGHDFLSAGSGNTILIGTAGSGDTLLGGPGEDTVYGSQGKDSITGGTGSDVIYSGPVASFISAGTGPDTVVSGASGDTIYGNGGPDVLVAGGGHDLIYADNPVGTGDSGAVSYLYGSYSGGPGAGSNTLIGGKGNDFLFGFGDTIKAGGAGSIVNNSLASAPVPGSPPPVASTSQAPLLPPGTTATLPTGVTYQGRWTEFAGSASGGGLSNTPGQAIDPAIVAGSAGEFVAWADSRSGTDQIDVAELTAAGWQSLGSLALGGSIFTTAGASLRPSIALGTGGQPVVAWTVFNGSSSDIFVAQYNPAANAGAGGWVALANSLSPGGISGTGVADYAQIVETTAGPVVAYQDRSSGKANVYVEQFTGGKWTALGSGAASGTGVSGSSTDVQGLTIATDGTNVAVAWTETVGATSQIYLREYSGGTWNAIGGSASGNGISNATGRAVAPTLAFNQGTLFVAWQDNSSGADEIYAAMYNGTKWVAAGTGAASGGGVSNTDGMAATPKLAASDGNLYLLWLDNRILNFSGNTIAPYVKQWNGSTFVEDVVGDSSYRGIGNAIGAPMTPALAVDPNGNPFVVWEDTSSGAGQIYVRGNTFALNATQPLHYVNDSSTEGDAFSSMPGAAANDGLQPATPKDSIPDVAAGLAPGDFVYVDAGTYSGFTLTSTSNGVIFMGSPNSPTIIQGPVHLVGVSNVTLENIDFAGGVTLTGGSKITLIDDTLGAGVTVGSGSDDQIVHDTIIATAAGTGITLTGGTNTDIEFDQIEGGAQGIALVGSGVSGLLVRSNNLVGSGTGIDLANPAAGQITENNVSAVNAALLLGATFTGAIVDNDFSGAAVGVFYLTGETLSDNRIHNNAIGVLTTVADPATALGYVAGTLPNQIYLNSIGVELANAILQSQHVYDNLTGVGGSGTLVPSDLNHANIIEGNVVGVNFTGPIEFNRIDWNSIGIEAQSNQLIAHNDIYRNTNTGIEVQGQTTVSIVNNTIFSTTGDLIRVEAGSSAVEMLNNVLWTEGGFDLFVADDSHSGFFSDYNDLYSTGTGQLVSWDGLAFNDILDWQQDVYQFDLNSIGRTVVNPLWAQPRFVGLSVGDFDIFDQLGGDRFTSPTIDAGDPITDQALPSYYNNMLANPGFENGLTGWTATPGSVTQSGTPAAWQGGSYFGAGGNAVATVEQTIDLTASGFTAQDIDTQNLNAIFGGRVRTGTANTSAAGTIEVTFYDSNGNALATYHRRRLQHDRPVGAGRRQPVDPGARPDGCSQIHRRRNGRDQRQLPGRRVLLCAVRYPAARSGRPWKHRRGAVDEHRPPPRSSHPRPVHRLGAERTAPDPLELVRQRQRQAGAHRPLSGWAKWAAIPDHDHCQYSRHR